MVVVVLVAAIGAGLIAVLGVTAVTVAKSLRVAAPPSPSARAATSDLSEWTAEAKPYWVQFYTHIEDAKWHSESANLLATAGSLEQAGLALQAVPVSPDGGRTSSLEHQAGALFIESAKAMHAGDFGASDTYYREGMRQMARSGDLIGVQTDPRLG